jgi:hypothetical protein
MPFEAQGEIETIRQEFNSTFSIVRSAIKNISNIIFYLISVKQNT